MRAKMVLAALAAVVEIAAFGGVTVGADGSVRIDGDRHGMNWMLAEGQYPFVTKDCVLGAAKCGEGFKAAFKAVPLGDGDVETVWTFTNTTDAPRALGKFEIMLPFNDNYPSSKECVYRRCNAHIWAGGDVAWIAGIRMGGEAPHLGWVMTEGNLSGYEIHGRDDPKAKSNARGVIGLTGVVDPKPGGHMIAPGEAWTVKGRFFAHGGWDDFKAKLLDLGGVWVEADKYVAEVGEKIMVSSDFINAEAQRRREKKEVSFEKPGEYRVEIEAGGKKTFAEVLVVNGFKELVKRRMDFYIEKQRYRNPDDPRNGALLCYDNETEKMLPQWETDHFVADMNEGRERLGMGVALAEMRYRLDVAEDYARFVRTALQEENYRTWGEWTPRKWHRIYNYAWVARLYFDMYEATLKIEYLDHGVGTVRAFARSKKDEGALRFYVIDMPIRQSLALLKKAGRTDEAAELEGYFRKMCDNYIAAGLFVPKSEVNYEQSIIAPAANSLVEFYLATSERKYLDGALALMPAVEAFNGRQPSWHLNDIAIRHWDGYWFGKRKMFGDTFPHYWSDITADLFGNLAEATGDETYLRRARAICKANLGLLTEDGRGGCAYLYPDAVDGRDGKFLDPMANDQDWAIVFASRRLDELK